MPKFLKFRVAKQVPSDVQTSDPNLNHRFEIFTSFIPLTYFSNRPKQILPKLSRIVCGLWWPATKPKIRCVCRMSHNLPFRKKSKLSSKEKKRNHLQQEYDHNIMINNCAYSMLLAASAQLHQRILSINAKVLNLTSFTSHGFAHVVCPHVLRSLKYTPNMGRLQRPSLMSRPNPISAILCCIEITIRLVITTNGT